MATNLLISVPGVERDATIEAHTTEDADYPAENAISSNRASVFRTSAAATQSQIDFDLETGNTATPDHLILSRLDIMTERDSADITVTVKGDDNAAFSTAQTFTDTPGTADLVGPEGEDYILALSPSGGERYWRLQIDTTASEIHEWNFTRLGTFLDLGRDPVYPATLEPFVGSLSSKRRGYSIALEWQGLTNAAVQSFETQVARTMGRDPVFLYDAANYVLNGHTLIPCYLQNYSMGRVTEGANTLSASFREFV